MTYTIMINEEQRSALEQVIREQKQFIPALEYWVEMLAELPKTEAELPNVVHGFCL